MMGIRIDIDNIIKELQEKELHLCYLHDKGIFIVDKEDRIYSPDAYSHTFYVQHLLRRKEALFHIANYTPYDGEMKIYSNSEIKEFIKEEKLKTTV